MMRLHLQEQKTLISKEPSTLGLEEILNINKTTKNIDQNWLSFEKIASGKKTKQNITNPKTQNTTKKKDKKKIDNQAQWRKTE